MCRTFSRREWGRGPPEPTACQSFVFSEGLKVLLETLPAKCGANVTNLLMLKKKKNPMCEIGPRGEGPAVPFFPLAALYGTKSGVQRILSSVGGPCCPNHTRDRTTNPQSQSFKEPGDNCIHQPQPEAVKPW